jgi:type IV fimbrial biogenesis protein FimT
VRRPRDWRSIQAQAGLTMIELIVVMLIVGILMGIGIPSYRYITYSNRTTTEVNSLLGDLQLARVEAVKEGQTVTVCPSSDAASCTNNSTTWQNGWIIFSDVNSDHTVADPKYILRVRPKFNSNPIDTFSSDNSMSYVSFNREGFVSGFPAAASSNYVTFTLHTTPQKSEWTRCLQLFNTGTANTQRTSDTLGNCS